MIHSLHTRLLLPGSREQVFDFFADAANLELLTPPELRFRILTPMPVEMGQGARIEYRLSLFHVSFGWRTRITEWEPPKRFVDVQERGPYRLWEHSHCFEESEGGTRVDDEVRYQLPFQPLGEIAHPLVRRQLDGIFAHRSSVLSDRFGAAAAE